MSIVKGKMAVCMDVQKEWKSAKRHVLTALRLFGPDNITSITDFDTLNDKLDQITTKLGIFMEKSQTVVDELEELRNGRNDSAETDQEVVRRVEEINCVTEIIIKKKNDNEINVKKKMEEVMKECNSATTTKKPINLALNKDEKTNKKDSQPSQPHSKLSDRIANYCEVGPFLTHHPQFIVTANYVIKHYQKKLPTIGILMKPVLVGGITDNTSGTLTAPDLDFSLQWELGDELTSHLVIRATDQGESGQYTLQIMDGKVDEFKSLFDPFVIDIQNHGRPYRSNFVFDKVNDAYLEEDGKTFICSDLFRGQLEGLVNNLESVNFWSFANFTTNDFSPTGAARSMSVDVKSMFRTWFGSYSFKTPEGFQHVLERFVDTNLCKLLPELDIDWTPVFTIPNKNLPKDLTIWEEQDSWLLDQETRENIKQAPLVVVAKSMDKEKGKGSKIWRLSLNSAPVMHKIIKHFEKLEPMCSVKKVLRMIKDLKNVALEGKERDFLKSYNVRQALIWSINENTNILTEEDILISTLSKIIQFYQKEYFPSFLEPKRNLIFKMSRNRLCNMAEKRVSDILGNLQSYMTKVEEVQVKHQVDIREARKDLSPVAPFLQFPVVSDSIAEKLMDKLGWLSDDASEWEGLKLVIKRCLTCFIDQMTNNEIFCEEVIREDNIDVEIPCSNQRTIDSVSSITAALPIDSQTEAVINNVATALAPAVEEVIPAVTPVLENINHLLNNVPAVSFFVDIVNHLKQ